jgi:hypothetical protein
MREAGHGEQEQELRQILQRVLVRSLDTVEYLQHSTGILLAFYVTINMDHGFTATRYPVI